MYGKTLDFTPGTNNKYSNYGYLLAGAVVEHLTGQKFFDYVKMALLQPAGITEVQVISTLASQRTSGLKARHGPLDCTHSIIGLTVSHFSRLALASSFLKMTVLTSTAPISCHKLPEQLHPIFRGFNMGSSRTVGHAETGPQRRSGK
jgi:CubicO group peptidase (beta-lactamase class C family)